MEYKRKDHSEQVFSLSYCFGVSTVGSLFYFFYKMKFLLSIVLVVVTIAYCTAQSDNFLDQAETKVVTSSYNTALSYFNQLTLRDRLRICDTLKCSGCSVTIKRTNHAANHYVGCFKDTPDRVLKREISLGEGTSVKNCIVACRKEGYVYAGTEVGEECFCGNHYPDVMKFPQLDDISSCNMHCKAEHSVKCGGFWAISVYETGNQSK